MGHEQELVPALIRILLRREAMVRVPEKQQVESDRLVDGPVPIRPLTIRQADDPAGCP